MSMPPLVAGVELGGTKSIAVLARGPSILARFEVPTTRPDETLPALAGWLDGRRVDGMAPTALGIGSFGPIGLDPRLPGHGRLGSTPKPRWAGADVLAAFEGVCPGPVVLDTDVNAPALAEARWGAARGGRVCAYLTIGTGIGVGVAITVDGQVHRLPVEFGHLRIRRAGDPGFAGTCPFHGDCAEGLIAGPAIAARAGAPAASLDVAHPIWAEIAEEAGELLAAITLALSPDAIVIGGGVGLSGNFPRAAAVEAADARLAGYLPGGRSAAELVSWTAFGADAGPIGAAALAYTALPDAARLAAA